MQTIELDCAPFSNPRPGVLINHVIDGTGLLYKEASAKQFGNWTWDYSEIDRDVWLKIVPTIRHRITQLHNKGEIRYGSW